MGLLKNLLFFLLSGIVCILLVLFAVRSSGHRLLVRDIPRELVEPVVPMSFDERPGQEPLARVEEREVKNLIFLIGDGMGPSHIMAARAELVGLNGRLWLERMPVASLISTHAITSLGTDSAAGATSLATGFKTRPGRLGVDRDNNPLRTLVEAAEERGMATGLVTDSYLWDATLSGFAVHVKSRRQSAKILQQMAGSGVEVLIGEREDLSEEEEAQMKSAFTAAGYAQAYDWESLGAALSDPGGGPLVGILDEKQIHDPAREPGLAELAKGALARLSGAENGFFLVVETEETDTASHHNNFPRMIAGVEALDQVAALALEFARENGETLVLATADHETGGLALLNASPDNPMEVRWGTVGHTASPVPLYAYGPGAEELSAARDNTDVAPILARLLGFDW